MRSLLRTLGLTAVSLLVLLPRGRGAQETRTASVTDSTSRTLASTP